MQGMFADNPHYTEYEASLKSLHQLIAGGEGDSDAADVLREEMDRSASELSHEEMTRLRGLSADLYMLQDDEIFEPPSPGKEPSSLIPEHLPTRMAEAEESGNWEAILTLLRKGAAGLPQEERAYRRAEAYEGLGHLDTALLFVRHAVERDPGNSSYRWDLLRLLEEMDQRDELYQKASEYLLDESSSPELRIYAAVLLFGLTREQTEEQALPAFERMVSALEPALSLLPQSSKLLRPDLPAYGHLTLGFCYQQLGRPDLALRAFTEAAYYPRHRGNALGASGMLLLDQSRQEEAFSAFESAIEANTSFVTPYLHLAHDALVRGDYKRSLELSARALERTQNPGVQSVVLQWQAIAGHETGAAADQVRHLFEAALKLDPLNPEIQHNFEIFRQRERAGPDAAPVHREWRAPAAPTIAIGENLPRKFALAA